MIRVAALVVAGSLAVGGCGRAWFDSVGRASGDGGAPGGADGTSAGAGGTAGSDAGTAGDGSAGLCPPMTSAADDLNDSVLAAGWHANKGVFLTTSTFTREAHEFARQVADSIVLIDGARLTALMIEHGVGVSHKPLKIPRIDSDYFEGE